MATACFDGTSSASATVAGAAAVLQAEAIRRTGAPLMRHLFLEHPQTPELAAVDDSYYLGPALLVAPVVAQPYGAPYEASPAVRESSFAPSQEPARFERIPLGGSRVVDLAQQLAVLDAHAARRQALAVGHDVDVPGGDLFRQRRAADAQFLGQGRGGKGECERCGDQQFTKLRHSRPPRSA